MVVEPLPQQTLELQAFSVTETARGAGISNVEAKVRGCWRGSESEEGFYAIGEHQSSVIAILDALGKTNTSVRTRLASLLEHMVSTGIQSEHPYSPHEKRKVSAFAWWRDVDMNVVQSTSSAACNNIVEASLDLLKNFDRDRRDNVLSRV